MARNITFLSLLALVCILGVQARIYVTMRVFSGIRDPSWILRGNLEVKALEYLQQLANSDVHYAAPHYQMGYTGFIIRTDDKIVRSIYGHQEFESFLLQSWPERVHYPQVLEHVYDIMSKRVLIETVNTKKVLDIKAKCDIPVIGSDNVTAYGPQTDCCGFFIRYQTENNCYDYGNDIVTNTFAQPGRGTGHKWDYNTCESVRAAAERDGLVWVGTTLPTGNPPIGHYISLHIWPNTNFHWLRKDTNMATHWSHKPGGTPVRDVDNNGNKITDPSKADVSPWSQFCGYMTTTPSKVTIN